jgi:hypothetical protein
MLDNKKNVNRICPTHTAKRVNMQYVPVAVTHP